MNEKPMSSAQMKAWPGAKEAGGLQQELGTEPRPADDLDLYDLVLENNRLLKALTERLTPKPQPDSSPASEARYSGQVLTESDMSHVLKTGEVPKTPDIAGAAHALTDSLERARCNIERLVRGQVADRLKAILYPNQWAPNGDLDFFLWEVERRVGALRTPLDNIKAQVRDAALEEAAERAVSGGMRTSPDAQTAAMAIRALKSKPAPKECIVPGCIVPPGHEPRSHHRDVSGRTWCTDVTDDFVASCSKPQPVQCLVPGCDRPHQHEGAHEPCGSPSHGVGQVGWACGCGARGNGEIPEHHARRRCRNFATGEIIPEPPEPVHDFGWALAQMRAGKKVRQASWHELYSIEISGDRIHWCVGNPRCSLWLGNSGHLLATDWEVVK